MALQHATASRSEIIESVKCGFGHHHSRQEAISYQRASTRVLKHRSQFIVTPKECRPHFLAACGLEEFSKQA